MSPINIILKLTSAFYWEVIDSGAHPPTTKYYHFSFAYHILENENAQKSGQ
jgi:hypothetical protein